MGRSDDVPGAGHPADAPPTEVPLQNTSHRKVVRIGDTVHRPMYPWSPAVHALLQHLADVGFDYAPRFLGVDAEGREILTYLPGDAGPAGWARVVDERGLVNAAHLLRDYHQAVAGWQPDPELLWANGKQGGGDKGDIICHGDFGPWNIVWDGVRPVGLIDWDYAYPGRFREDVIYALEYVTPFRDDREAMRWLAYDRAPQRRRRLEIFARSYGAPDSVLDRLADHVIDGQRKMLDQVRTLAAAGCQPQKQWVENGHLQELEARITWTENNRALFHGSH